MRQLQTLFIKCSSYVALAVIGATIVGGAIAYANFIEDPWTKNIYNVSDPSKNESGGESRQSVSVFDDADNKCYVVTTRAQSGTDVAISCVRRGDR